MLLLTISMAMLRVDALGKNLRRKTKIRDGLFPYQHPASSIHGLGNINITTGGFAPPAVTPFLR